MDTEPATPTGQEPQYNGTSSDPETSKSFLDSVDGENVLFRAMTRARPIGIHRHFHMMCILRQIQKETGHLLDGNIVWEKLREMYDLDTLNDLEEAEDYNGFIRSPSPAEILSNHPFFKQEFSLYALPRDMDLDVIIANRRRRDTPSVDSTPDIIPPFRPEPPPVETGPKKRGRKRKHPLPPPPPAPKPEKEARTATPTLTRQSAVPGSDSEISALTENSDVDVESTVKTEPEVLSRPVLRSSVVASTPGSMGEEIDIVEVTSPAPIVAPPKPPPAKRGRKPKAATQVAPAPQVPQDPGQVVVKRKRGRPPKIRPPPPPPPPPTA